ncbi:PDZ domain-containing protein [bacterium]|nr:PDZ domain-containing protein [bacterium]
MFRLNLPILRSARTLSNPRKKGFIGKNTLWTLTASLGLLLTAPVPAEEPITASEPAIRGAAPAAAAEGAQDSAKKQNLENPSLELFSQLTRILTDNASEPPAPQTVVKFCREAVRGYLQEKELDNAFIDKIGGEQDEIKETYQAVSAIAALYKGALQKFPELAEDVQFSVCIAKAIMESAQDDYTVFVSLSEYRDFNSDLTGDYSGSLGLTLKPYRDGEGGSHFEVAELLEGAPAQKGGLHIGDELTAVDGKSLEKALPSECSALLRGPNGSQVDLTYRSRLSRIAGSKQTRKLRLTRAKVHYPAAKAEVLPHKEGELKIGLLTLDMFTLDSNLEAERALRELEKDDCQAYILDLRGNPGGYTNAARDICSKFLPKPALLASLKDNKGHIEQQIKSYRNMHAVKPLAVLIDGQTASAAEITAGALKAHKAAFLVGMPSFGKNSSQRIFNFDFPPGETSACKVTYSHYITPDNLDLGKTGLTPDYTVEMPARLRRSRAKDIQLQKAVEVLNELNKNKD